MKRVYDSIALIGPLFCLEDVYFKQHTYNRVRNSLSLFKMDEQWLKTKIVRVESILSKVATFSFMVLVFPILYWFYWVCVLRRALVRTWLSWREKGCARVASGMDALWTSDVAGSYYPITTVLFLRGTPDVASLRSQVLKQVTTVEELAKLLQHQADKLGLFVWRYEKNFSIEDHVLKEQTVKDEHQLQRVLARLSTRPFSNDRSPWRLHVVPIEEDEVVKRFCVVFVVDHSMADGLSLVHVFMKNVMDVPIRSPSAPATPKTATTKKKMPLKRILYTLVNAPSVFASYLTRGDRHSLHGPQLSHSKIVRWSRPIAVDDLRRIRRVVGASFNDVYLSCLTGAIRRHFLSQGPNLPHSVTSVVPMALPPLKQGEIPLENNITVALLRLPIHVEDSSARVAAMSRIMNEGKQSPEVIINAWSFRKLVNCMPLGFSRRIFRRKPATLVSSTVAGPPEPLNVWGWHLERVLYYSPHRGPTGVTSCLISYAGKATLTLYVDKALVANESEVDKMINYFDDEVNVLTKLVSKVKTK